MNEVEVFIQGEGMKEIQILRISAEARVEELVEEAHRLGLPRDGAVRVLPEDGDVECVGGTRLTEAGIGHRSRIHCHRCRRVGVTVNFAHRQLTREFPPAATLERVKRWADRELGLTDTDATEHALQICNTTTRPAEDTHVGTLVAYPVCAVCFDLVPKVRVEG